MLLLLLGLQVTWLQLIIRSLDVVTIAVPPALPAAITTGTIYAQSRLKNRGIFCISPPRINVCGKVSLFCFDKVRAGPGAGGRLYAPGCRRRIYSVFVLQTGTLTEEGLDVWGVMEAGPAGFSDLVPDPRLLAPGPLQSGLACCHTVTLLDGQAIGDPLELKMVESVGWVPGLFCPTLNLLHLESLVCHLCCHLLGRLCRSRRRRLTRSTQNLEAAEFWR